MLYACRLQDGGAGKQGMHGQDELEPEREKGRQERERPEEGEEDGDDLCSERVGEKPGDVHEPKARPFWRSLNPGPGCRMSWQKDIRSQWDSLNAIKSRTMLQRSSTFSLQLNKPRSCAKGR